MKNLEMDKLLCLVDGQITAYRMKYSKDLSLEDALLREIQQKIQVLWQLNKEGV
jgi:hypothetical protein